MKHWKKATSIISTIAFLAAMASMPASARSFNDYTLEYETLTQNVITADGNVVPAGSVAVTLSISNSSGFDANTIVFDIGDNDQILTDNAGEPIVTKENILSNALLAAHANDSTVCVAVAMDSFCNANGELFTFYLSGSDEDVTITSTDEVVNLTAPSGMIGETATPNMTVKYKNGHWYHCYFRGDADNDDDVNAVDASVIYQLTASKPNHVYNVNTESNLIKNDFGVYYAEQPDANNNGYINNTDALLILDFAANAGAGEEYYGDPYVGQEVYVQID